jgi:hypothetical protein
VIDSFADDRTVSLFDFFRVVSVVFVVSASVSFEGLPYAEFEDRQVSHQFLTRESSDVKGACDANSAKSGSRDKTKPSRYPLSTAALSRAMARWLVSTRAAPR